MSTTARRAPASREEAASRRALDAALARLARRVRARAALRALGLVLALVLGAGSLLALGARLGDAALSLPWLLGAAALLLVGAPLGAWWRTRPAPRRLALALDRAFATRELISAALEAGAAPPHPLGREAQRRAAEALSERDPARVVPLAEPRRWRAPALAAGCLALALLVPLPPLAGASTTERPPARDAGTLEEETLAALEELAPELMRLESIEHDELKAQLERFLEELDEGEGASPSEALAALDALERALDAAMEQEASLLPEGAPRQTLEALSADPQAARLLDALSRADREALARAIEAAAGAGDPGEALSAQRGEALERAAAQLEALAELLAQQGNEGLAEHLREIADAIREGDIKRARELMERLELRAGECPFGAHGQCSSARAVIEGARYLLGAGPPPKLLEAEGGTAGAGAGGAGSQPGKGTSNEAGEYAELGPMGPRDRQSDATSAWLEDYEALADSQLIEPETWQDLLAEGRVDGDAPHLARPGLSLGAASGGTSAGLAAGAPAAGGEARALDLERVPRAYRDLVRRYFERGGTQARPVEGEEAAAPPARDE